MNNHDRLRALLSGKAIDRVMLFPFILGFCTKNVGYPIESIYSNAKKSFDSQMKTLEQYGFDWGPIYGYASYGTWEFGGEIEMPTGEFEQAPSQTRFPVESENDLVTLQHPDIKTAGAIPIAMEFSQMQDEFDMPISVVCGGNFTLAGNICLPDTLLRWVLKKPELAHKMLRIATDHIIDLVQYWADVFGAERVIPQFWEPLAANDLLSPKQFEKFVLPYLKESSERMLAMGIKHILYHICGEQNANMPYWAQIPMGEPGLASFGKEIDIDTAIKWLGNKAIIIGNISTQLLLTGPSDKIYDHCLIAIEKGKNAPHGFMLSSACEIPPATPGYHVYLMRKAVDDFGSYP